MVRTFNPCSVGGRSAKDRKQMQDFVANVHDEAETLAGSAVRGLGRGFHNTGYCAPYPEHETSRPMETGIGVPITRFRQCARQGILPANG